MSRSAAQRVKVFSPVALWNIKDESLVRAGRKKPLVEQALVDTGATDVVIPARIVRALSLNHDGYVNVRYADMRKGRRRVAIGLRLRVLGRSMTCDAIVEPNRETILLGLIVLEALDLIVESRRKRLAPNPDSPRTPTIDLFQNRLEISSGRRRGGPCRNRCRGRGRDRSKVKIWHRLGGKRST